MGAMHFEWKKATFLFFRYELNEKNVMRHMIFFNSTEKKNQTQR